MWIGRICTVVSPSFTIVTSYSVTSDLDKTSGAHLALGTGSVCFDEKSRYGKCSHMTGVGAQEQISVTGLGKPSVAKRSHAEAISKPC
jgi:hypothetical protein